MRTTDPNCKNSSRRGHRQTLSAHISWLIAVALGLALCQLPSSGNATSCMRVQISVTTLCGRAGCTKGFKVTDEPLMSLMCGGLPNVQNLEKSELAILNRIVRHHVLLAPNTIYQLDLYPECLRSGSRDESCQPGNISVTTLNTDADSEALAKYRAEWLEKRRGILEESAERTATTAKRIAMITLLAIVWPWIAAALVPIFRKYLVILLTIAVPGQMFLIYAITLVGSISIPAGGIMGLAKLFVWLLQLAIPLQFAYPLWRIIKRKLSTAR